MNLKTKNKVAFNTSIGHYVYNTMPFVLKGALAACQRLMNSILGGINGIKCFIYLDNIVVDANNLTEHNKRLTNIFQRFQQHNLKLQPSKCEFLRKQFIFRTCYYRIWLKLDPSKVENVSNFSQLKNPKDI